MAGRLQLLLLLLRTAAVEFVERSWYQAVSCLLSQVTSLVRSCGWFLCSSNYRYGPPKPPLQ